jgi:deoxyadenosine/deoxycytidine kinase
MEKLINILKSKKIKLNFIIEGNIGVGKSTLLEALK